MIRPRAAIAWATESTRKGMSSLTTQIRIRRWPSRVPVDSMPDQGGAGRAAAGAAGDELGGRAAILRAEILELPGQGAGAQGAAEIVQQALVSGISRYQYCRLS